MLNLEGCGKKFGWHTYLFYDKKEVDGGFLHHFVRKALYKVWIKYKAYLGEKIPLWVAPSEVITPFTFHEGEQLIMYKDLVEVKNKNYELKK